MSALFLSLTAAAGLGVSAHMAWRDHRRAMARRASLFDDCRTQQPGARVSVQATGFPRIDFPHALGLVRAELIPDTMTIRRLPQLWLSVTLFQKNRGQASFAVLVRPSGGDDYALVHRFENRLEPPPGLPSEIIIRGDGEAAQSLVDRLAAPLGDILADPRVKEIAATPRGLRITTQSSEGRRGEHLLLRQAVFDDAEVAPGDLADAVARLATLASALSVQSMEVAA